MKGKLIYTHILLGRFYSLFRSSIVEFKEGNKLLEM